MYALAASDSTLYAAGCFTSIAWEPQSGLAAFSTAALDTTGLTDVPTVAELLSLTLAQPAPNPAGARTLIRFTLPADGPVTLAVYDLQGRRVVSLLNRALQSAGVHDVPVRTDGWPAGCYFCRLEASGVSVTRRMLVVR